MSSNKFNFIREILLDRKITTNLRERIIELASREVDYEVKLEERIKKIEEIIFNNDSNYDSQNGKSPQYENKSDKPTYIEPYNLYDFLFKYNQHPILRSTCHDIDSEELENINDYCKTHSYELQKHLKKILEGFNELENTSKKTKFVKPLIRVYLTGHDYYGKPINSWSSENIELNWSSIELSKWSINNPGIPPNLNEELAGDWEIDLLDIPQINSPVTYASIQNFTQLVLHFKNLFHIRSGHQSLKAIIERKNISNDWNNKVEFEITDQDFQSNIELFTDVDKLMQSYNKILAIIIKQHQRNDKPRVKLSFYQRNHIAYFSIHHLNGKYNKTLQDFLTRPTGVDYNNLIEKQINGLCNLHLKANFGNNDFARINLWNRKEITVQKLESFNGVEHILEFPKTNKFHDLPN